MRYPKAIWKGDGRSGGSFVGFPYRFVVHTTETQGVPGYNSGGSAPHLTYYTKTRRFYQHTTLATAARALRHPKGTVQTNRGNAIQLEIVCYSAKGIADQSPNRLWVGDLTDDHYGDLSDLVDWTHREFGVRKSWPLRQAFNHAEANAAGFRLTPGEWRTCDYVVGHQHVPHNTHWDPGALDWGRLLAEDNMAILSDEAQQWWEDTYRALQDLEPGTNQDFARVLIEEYRDRKQAGQVGHLEINGTDE